MKSKQLWKQGAALALAATLLLGGTLPMEASAAWRRDSVGWWWQQDDGGYPTSSWQLINGTWYYFDESGYMAEGWLLLGDTWYYLNPGSGAMAEGWLLLGDTWYYLNPGSGAMAEGWLLLGDTWYYLNPGNGAMAEGWLLLGDTWYYLNPGSGAMAEGWLQVGDKWYYLNPGSGAMAADTYIDGYYVDASGARIEDGSQNPSQGQQSGKPSSYKEGWVHDGDLWWYRHEDGGYTTNGWEQINGAKYYFDNAGWMVTGWRLIDGSWYYFGGANDGAMKTSQWVGDYYVGADGVMATNQTIDGYYVGADGKWIPDASNNGTSGNGSNPPATSTVSVEPNYYYDQLSTEEKAIYDALLEGARNLESNIDSGTGDPDLAMKACAAMRLDHCELFWIDFAASNGITYVDYGDEVRVSFHYTMATKAEKDSKQAQIDSAVDSLIGGVSMADSDYNKAKAVFEALVDSVSYDLNAKNAHSMMGPLLDGQSVCEGYAKATQYMLNKLGVPCIFVEGEANGVTNGAHAWNIALINGKYYHIDTTWGDPISNSANNINYNYLCATDEEIYRSHELKEGTPFTVPTCTSTDFDSYRADGGYFEAYDVDAIGNYIKAKYAGGEATIGIKLANEEAYNQVISDFLGNRKIFNYCNKGYSVTQNPDFYTLTFTFR